MKTLRFGSRSVELTDRQSCFVVPMWRSRSEYFADSADTRKHSDVEYCFAFDFEHGCLSLTSCCWNPAHVFETCSKKRSHFVSICCWSGALRGEPRALYSPSSVHYYYYLVAKVDVPHNLPDSVWAQLRTSFAALRRTHLCWSSTRSHAGPLRLAAHWASAAAAVASGNSSALSMEVVPNHSSRC